jgi:decaprenylphospho-beta-D-erythro-pentofuranosid-2-ulose 2-reductase
MEKTFGKGCRVLIVGATSGIAQELAKQFAGRGFDLVLAARDQEELQILAADAKIRGLKYGVQVQTLSFSALDYESHAAFWKECGDVDGVICCFGLLEGEIEARSDWEHCRKLLEINFNANVSLLNLVANDFEARKHGFIAVLGSVAGDRGRSANYIYGSAKSGLATYAEGLRQRLFHSGVSVTTIKPGPVDTGMTWGMDKLPLLVPPEKVASDIYRGLRRKADVVYSPLPWRVIMAIMRFVPARIWKKLKF